ncbi:MAG: DUF502 domain-containing protein [Pseudomonadota bacterium]
MNETSPPPTQSAPIDLRIGLMARLRAYFFAGILITAPISITFYIAWNAIRFVDEWVGGLLPRAYNPNTYLPFSIPGLGLAVATLVLILVGAITAGMIGRLFIRLSEGLLARMPVVRSVYAAVKQIFETVLAQRATFRQAVLVEFPRAGLWRIAFVTGSTPGKTQTIAPGGLVNVFIPGTPNIASGFLVLVPARELVELDLSVEEAVKLVVSGGLATPARPAQPERSNLTAASRSNK